MKLLFIFLPLFSLSAGAQTKVGRSQVVPENSSLRSIVMGKKVNDITSCGVVDSISWRFRPDGRQARVLVRDTLRMNAETEFFSWEISQVMDADGFSTFVFRRALKKNRYEAYAVKDGKYNKILDTRSGPHVVETRDIKNLINKPAFVFSAPDGASVILTPGAYKTSVLSFIPSRGEDGQVAPPVYIKNMICFRPEEKYEFIKVKEEAGAGSQQAPAGGGGAATQGPARK